jgi:hypothetical protein
VVAAFLAWAVRTSGAVQDLFGASQELSTAIMTTVAWGRGFVDEPIVELLGPAPNA